MGQPQQGGGNQNQPPHGQSEEDSRWTAAADERK